MPADALPVPWSTPLSGTVHYRREYRDVLSRPLVGKVTITGETRSADDATVIPVASVIVELAAGVLEVDLPPDTYRLAAKLRTVDGASVTDADTVTLTA